MLKLNWSDDSERLSHLSSNLETRAAILEYTRKFFRKQGFLEVDTPIRSPAIAPELNVIPLLSEGWYLTTSPELYMKRLLAAGYQKLFQISHCFRKGERGRLHNPEFTLLEWYRAKGDYRDMVADTEQLTVFLAKHIKGKPMLDYRGHSIDLTTPWPEITVQESFVRFTNWNPVADADSLRFDLDLCDKVIPAFATKRPTVLLDYPAAMASLARLKPGEPQVAERAEVFLGGLEIANAYSELIDPEEQAKRFKQEIEQMEKRQGRQIPLPMRFLEAMPNMPECGGIALGIDRLVMLFCNAESIDEVIPFSIDTA